MRASVRRGIGKRRVTTARSMLPRSGMSLPWSSRNSVVFPRLFRPARGRAPVRADDEVRTGEAVSLRTAVAELQPATNDGGHARRSRETEGGGSGVSRAASFLVLRCDRAGGLRVESTQVESALARLYHPSGNLFSHHAVMMDGVGVWHYKCVFEDRLHDRLAAPSRGGIDTQCVVDRLLGWFGASRLAHV